MIKGIQEFSESYPFIGRIVFLLVLTIVVYFVRRFILNRLYGQLKESTNWYMIRKIAVWMSNIVLLLFFLYVFGDKLSGFSTTIGLAGAGVTYALREVIVSFAGWFAIIFGDFFKSGDRILLGGTKGDVVDIGFLRTTMMEIGEWVDGDQYTGRIVLVANSYIFTSPVYNYTGNFEFLWDEIKIPIRFGGDVQEARNILLEAAEKHTGTPNAEAKDQWTDMQKKYKLEDASLQPQVYATFNENWIELNLRYIVYYNQRRGVKDELYMSILEKIRQSKQLIEIAAETIEIKDFQKKE